MKPRGPAAKGWVGSRCPDARAFVGRGRGVAGVDTAGRVTRVSTH